MARRHAARDDGNALVMVLVLMVVGSLMVLPLLTYAAGVLRANTVVSRKMQRVEAAKAGLWMALSDPRSLYDVCAAGTPAAPVRIASPGLSVPVTTDCALVGSAGSQGALGQALGAAATQAGQAVPASLKGIAYGPQTSPTQWIADATAVASTGKVWLPNLPVRGLQRRTPVGHAMPKGFPACTVYFPGTYVDPVTVRGPAYFTSGIYYFQKPVTIVGGADVVVGAGARPGCTTDQEAVFNAVDAPAVHDITGQGGTFVFGDTGQLVVEDSNGLPIGLRFNQRYVVAGDSRVGSTAGVSIMSVNGSLTGATAADLDVPGVLRVPVSRAGLDGSGTVVGNQYVPSTLVVTAAPAPPPTTTGGSGTTTTTSTTVAVPSTVAPAVVQPRPIVDIDASRTSTVVVAVPGYVAVPQGRLRVANPRGNDIRITGGILAASFDVTDARAGTPPQPQSLPIGNVSAVVQRTFRIVARAGQVTSTAIVQVNQNWAFAINSWVVQ